nr:hypothetical protein Iba_chr02bCG16720 [Ipomoea batatas]
MTENEREWHRRQAGQPLPRHHQLARVQKPTMVIGMSSNTHGVVGGVGDSAAKVEDGGTVVFFGGFSASISDDDGERWCFSAVYSARRWYVAELLLYYLVVPTMVSMASEVELFFLSCVVLTVVPWLRPFYLSRHRHTPIGRGATGTDVVAVDQGTAVVAEEDNTTAALDVAAMNASVFRGRNRARRTFCDTTTLTFEKFSEYFYLPSEQAAEELQVVRTYRANTPGMLLSRLPVQDFERCLVRQRVLRSRATIWEQLQGSRLDCEWLWSRLLILFSRWRSCIFSGFPAPEVDPSRRLNIGDGIFLLIQMVECLE